MECAVSFKGINKRFGPVHALKDINFDIYKGETLALVGENGAGKSTLMKILTRAYSNEEGTIKIDGQVCDMKKPQDAKDLGIGQVYQQAEIVPELTVSENIFLGEKELTHQGPINWKKINNKSKELLEYYNINIDAKETIGNLSVAECQLVSVVKVLQRDPKVIIFDEPTAVLSEREVKVLFEIIRRLKEDKKTIVYISHRLDEVFQVADRVAVLRDGALVATLENDRLTNEDLIGHMLGRKLSTMYPTKTKRKSDTVVLEAKNICTNDVEDISFELYEGEILGVAGLVGSGRTEMVRAIFGADAIQSGSVNVLGKENKNITPKRMIAQGVFLAPEDRQADGLVLGRNIRENISLTNFKKLSKNGFFKRKTERRLIGELKDKLDIRAPSIETKAGDLSGGNQQKVVIGKALMASLNILIADEPTQGIDVGAKAEIYKLLHELAAEGISVLLVSSELEEVMGLCNRVIVMREGRVMGELSDEEIDDGEKILNLMYGGQS